MPVTQDVAPHLTAGVLNAIMSKTVAQCSRAELDLIRDAIGRITAPLNPSAPVSDILK